ncbi:Oidioi.mRNA.OKI2018_I69.chr1.g581.t1.cds [Oikopleura dioica]|uniref:Oidioi.mRNA.OKI2018_I69.chr1.g581.t1.cds n=1 Tax=Oikopleura dioica TaxID=34765 RepID=A0ABN7SKT4_OIKDI|nr:Oidioi.mRNA.OKI2018_I69.chr1.g581.t1.cds [Oikopleura dioica]
MNFFVFFFLAQCASAMFSDNYQHKSLRESEKKRENLTIAMCTTSGLIFIGLLFSCFYMKYKQTHGDPDYGKERRKTITEHSHPHALV